MSYILDALKRADAERERGHVPGLHSQSPASLAPSPLNARPRRSRAMLMVGAAVLSAFATAAWWWLSAPADAPPPPAAAQAPADAPRAAPPMPAPTPADAARTETPPVPPAPALPILAPAPAAPRTPDAAGAAVAAPPSGSAGPARPTPGEDRSPVRSWAELPPDVRAQLPPIQVSGATYSSNPAHRMLILNGQVTLEGTEIAPGLRLETIGPRSAVLNHQGTRYSVAY